jgi:molybdopterin/thiamine biosynthesis adenylyltransferase
MMPRKARSIWCRLGVVTCSPSSCGFGGVKSITAVPAQCTYTRRLPISAAMIAEPQCGLTRDCGGDRCARRANVTPHGTLSPFSGPRSPPEDARSHARQCRALLPDDVPMSPPFDYDSAFERNIGWLTLAEQARLRDKRVAIAGLGGVGGIHLLTLARLGIARFRIADFDTFALANFNRQAGALVSTLDQPKVAVLQVMARDINPEVQIGAFAQGVDAGNIDAFLEGVDLYVDGLDFFAFDAREGMFKACAERRIPAITVAPLGMGAALLNFLPGSMSFEDYFGWRGQSEREKALRFLVGLAPRVLHADYLADASRVDLSARRGPSTIMACQLCAGIAATEALKILLGRGRVLAAPHGIHFDAYRNKLVHTWRPGGHRNPLQQLLMAVVRRRMDRIGAGR